MVQANAEKRSRARWLVIVGVVALAAVAVFWWIRRPRTVVVANPRNVAMTETIASSARVGGVQESAIGAQFTGTVERLFVRIGDRVKPGQPIATLKNSVTQQQREQARIAVGTARARLTQASRRPLKSEVDEAAHQVEEANAQVTQVQADLRLATRDLERARQMYDQGLMPRNEFDRVISNQKSLSSRLNSNKATVQVRKARLETLEKSPRQEDVMVAKAQLAEAEQALQVADQQAKDATVKAPFAGVVTALNAEQGQTVGANGVVNLVSDDLEIRVDLDENNLADLELGQTAILSSAAFGGKSFQGKLTDLGAAVDESRGIVTVKITPENPPDWLRPGQTVNVNLVTNEKVDRLIVPSTSILRQGSRTVVRVVEDGKVAERVVATRPATEQGVPISSGLSEADDVVVNPEGTSVGQEVRIRRQG